MLRKLKHAHITRDSNVLRVVRRGGQEAGRHDGGEDVQSGRAGSAYQADGVQMEEHDHATVQLKLVNIALEPFDCMWLPATDTGGGCGGNVFSALL